PDAVDHGGVPAGGGSGFEHGAGGDDVPDPHRHRVRQAVAAQPRLTAAVVVLGLQGVARGADVVGGDAGAPHGLDEPAGGGGSLGGRLGDGVAHHRDSQVDEGGVGLGGSLAGGADGDGLFHGVLLAIQYR